MNTFTLSGVCVYAPCTDQFNQKERVMCLAYSYGAVTVTQRFELSDDCIGTCKVDDNILVFGEIRSGIGNIPIPVINKIVLDVLP